MGKINWIASRPLSRTVFRAISIFSGVKLLSVFCSLIRNKLIAVLIGPAGMGLISLYYSCVEMFSNMTRLSVDQSAIRDISAESAPSHRDEISVIVRRWCLWLGIAGALLMCALSPLLSIWTFGDSSHWPAFCALSLVPFSMTISAGRTSLMTGLNMLGRLARTSAYTAVAAVLLSLALLWAFGEDAIVPMLIANAVAALFVALAFSPRVPKLKLSFRTIWRKGSGFIRLGILMTVATVVSNLFAYIFLIYLQREASTADVGIYNAGNTLVNTYVSVVFAGIWVEYYPRVSRAIHSARSTSAMVCHEISLTLCILLPIAMAFITADGLIVNILYDKSFIPVLPFLSIAILGIVFRTFSWSVAFVIIARGDGKTYILTECTDAVIGLTLNIIGWNLGGMAGLGVSYVLWYMIYSCIVCSVYRLRYKLRMPRRIIGLTLLIFSVVAATLLLKIYVGWWASLLATIAAVPVCLKALGRHPKAV